MAEKAVKANSVPLKHLLPNARVIEAVWPWKQFHWSTDTPLEARGSHRGKNFATDDTQSISEPASQAVAAAGQRGAPKPPIWLLCLFQRHTHSRAQRKSLVPTQPPLEGGTEPMATQGCSLPDHKEKRLKQLPRADRWANENGQRRLGTCYWSSSFSPKVLLWWTLSQITSTRARTRLTPRVSVFQGCRTGSDSSFPHTPAVHPPGLCTTGAQLFWEKFWTVLVTIPAKLQPSAVPYVP